MGKIKLLCYYFLLFGPSTLASAQSVVITSVKLLKSSYTQQKPINFTPGDTIVRLNYRQNNIAIHFRSPEKNPGYVYELGILDDIPIATRDSFLILPSLPDGEFSVMVYDQHHPDLRPAQLQIIVQSPLWRRWWFLPMMFLYNMLFISSILYLLHRYRLRQFMRLQATRDFIARDLHDDMGSSLSSISILSQTAQRTATNDPQRTRETLERIGETARQVMDTMSDIVWSVNPKQDGMLNVVHRIQAIADDLFGQSDVRFEIKAEETVQKMQLPIDKRRDFILICKEALTNAAKYASASQIIVQFHRANSHLVVTISDDGHGFDPAHLHKQTGSLTGNGLPNMQARALKLGGELAIRSIPGQGTTISFAILL